MSKDRITLEELIRKSKAVIEKYRKDFPDVKVDRDYFPFKCTEEWGECLKAYLMLTNRGRDKGKNEEKIQEEFGKELADVFAFVLLFADNEGIDLAEVMQKKWFDKL